MKEVEQGRIVVFIDEIHLVIGAGQVEESSIDVANLLKPYLGRKGSKFIGATTIEEYNKYICSDPTFERRFQKVDVNEPNNIDATNILRGLKNVFETKYRVEITDAALIAAVEYSSRYITERKLPDKAIELLDEACTVLKLQLESHPDVISDLHDKIENLKLQSRALRRESDPASKARYIEVIKEIDASEREVKALLARYKGERTKLEDLHFHREYREKFYVKYEKLANKECAEGLELMRKIGNGNERIKEIEGSMMLVDKVGPNEIAKAVSRRTGIPVTKIGADERKKLETLADKLNEKVIGQEQAVGPIVSTESLIWYQNLRHSILKH